MIPKVYSLLRRIPKGKVTTYGELAKSAGLHPRTIGMLMRKNKDPKNIPCYKVVRSDGSIGGYSAKGGTKTKIKLLQKDGIRVENGKINLVSHLHRFSKS
ncbi:MAG: MGMT family protein [Candidatus Aenigmatarchaeota archaeon]|nr:MAG: MGMT family protein [Candidatus Aenigmarchaeota archaeon]